jgi:hypothetical protein
MPSSCAFSALPPCIIDVEASGFGAGSYPIEVGAVLSDGRAYCSLINPEPDWRHWELSAESVHGITRDTLATHGKPAHVVASDLNKCLQGATVYTDAWYHDYQWLARLFDAAELPQLVQAAGPAPAADRTCHGHLGRHQNPSHARHEPRPPPRQQRRQSAAADLDQGADHAEPACTRCHQLRFQPTVDGAGGLHPSTAAALGVQVKALHERMALRVRQMFKFKPHPQPWQDCQAQAPGLQRHPCQAQCTRPNLHHQHKAMGRSSFTRWQRSV